MLSNEHPTDQASPNYGRGDNLLNLTHLGKEKKKNKKNEEKNN